MSEMPRNFDMRGNPSANPNLTSGRVEGYYEMGFPTVWAIQDMLANIRELNATVDQLKAAQSAPAPKVLYEGELYSGGAHARPAGILRDMEKNNFAVLHNWRVLRYSTQHVTGDPEGMIAQIRTVLERETQS